MALPKSIRELSDLFSSLPGIGPKLSLRIALYLAVSNKSLAKNLNSRLVDCLENISECSRCNNVTQGSALCEICDNEGREQSIIMLVESPIDLYAIEDGAEYKGVYHVLKGVISPVNGVGPSDLTIEKLVSRVKDNPIKEIIFALNPDVDGDSTSMYIKTEVLEIDSNVKFTKLAQGIPTGSNIEYMSSQTLSESFKSRDLF